MKRIKPISIWTPKGFVSCNAVVISSTHDDLDSEMEIHYKIGIVENESNLFTPIVEGNDYIRNEEYAKLGSMGIDINEEIKKLILSKINLELA